MQTQETMTAQVASCIQSTLLLEVWQFVIDAQHQCMTTRGIKKSESSTVTSRMLRLYSELMLEQDQSF